MRRLALLVAIGLWVEGVGLAKSCCGRPAYFDCQNLYSYCDVYIDADIGAYRLAMPAYSWGEILNAEGLGISPISELSTREDRLNLFYPRLAVGIDVSKERLPCWVGSDLFFDVGVFYTIGDKKTFLGDGSFPGFAFPRLAGDGDFLASDTAVTFSGVELKRKYRYSGGQMRLGTEFSANPAFTFAPFIEFDIDGLQQEYTVHVGGITGDVLAANYLLDEHLNTVYYDFGLGVDVAYTFSQCESLVLFAQGVGFVSSAHTKLKGTESAFTTPMLPISDIRKFHDALSGKARGQLGVGYKFGENLILSVIAQIDYWGYVPMIANPHRLGVSADAGVYDRPARIEPRHTTNYALYARLTVIFF